MSLSKPTVFRKDSPLMIDEVLLDNPDFVVSEHDYMMMKWLEGMGLQLGLDFNVFPKTHDKIFSDLGFKTIGKDGSLIERLPS